VAGRVELEGALNFRDLGGYATPNGPVRSGLVYRSDNLAGLTDGDLVIVSKLGLKAGYDFRNDAEVERQPSRLPDSIKIRRRLVIGDDVVEAKAFIDQILDGDLTQYTEEDASVSYQEILTRFGGRFAELLEALAVEDDLPGLFHCTAGKDRTGVTAMTLLGLAGVSDSYILDDYEVSFGHLLHGADGANWFSEQIRAAGYDPDDYQTLWESPRPVMRKTLDGLHEKWGDPESYVRSIGVNDEVAGRARAALRVA